MSAPAFLTLNLSPNLAARLADAAERTGATTEQTDRVVPTPDHPEEVEAVHGPYLVTLNLTDPTDAARADPTWIYRVQRTALEAAGATILLKPGMAADPITPGPTPAPAAFAWRTSGHLAPSWSALSDPRWCSDSA